ncbi:MAG: GlmU family protein [Bacteroidota bacterium]
MINRICIFEDQFYRRLLPLVYTRPVYDLRCGIVDLGQKLRRQYPNIQTILHVRRYLSEVVRRRNPGLGVNEVDGDGCLFLNGRLLATNDLGGRIPLTGEDVLYVQGETLVAARISAPSLDRLRRALPEAIVPSTFGDIPKKAINVKLIDYPWDIINNNGQEIVSDYVSIASSEEVRIRGTVYEGAHLINREKITIGEGSKVKPGVVLDAENGPIFIGNNVTVFPNAVIEGPAFVGDRSLIKIGAKIYENTSIGEVCKVGGEVEASIIHSYSNKQHDGFLGHAYLGQWVNLGADTNNSDLKNNYGNVKLVLDGDEIDSGSMFMGLIMGDHSKSSINTMFNTGTVVGVSSNIFGSGFPSKFVPSFAWGGANTMETYEFERALSVARRVMGRRKLELSAADESVLRSVFDLTGKDRKAAGMIAR